MTDTTQFTDRDRVWLRNVEDSLEYADRRMRMGDVILAESFRRQARESGYPLTAECMGEQRDDPGSPILSGEPDSASDVTGYVVETASELSLAIDAWERSYTRRTWIGGVLWCLIAGVAAVWLLR